MPNRNSLVGRSVGNYRLVQLLGAGGMGAVYLGEHPQIHSRVAIKVLLPRFVENADVTRRFFDEARAVNRIGHSGIVRIHDCGQQEGIGVFLVMELLEGNTLEELLCAQGTFREERVVRLLRQTASALDASHRAGIIHRDLKPSNLFVVSDPEIPGGERIKILDFGIAKLLEESASTSPEAKPGATKTGMVLGSLLFMSPEQGLDTKHVDERTDIYSLGVIGYNLLSDAVPFEADTLGQLVLKQQQGEAAPLRSVAPAVSERLAAIVHRTIAIDPDDRFESMIELRAALDELIDLPASSSPPRPDAGKPDADKPVSEPHSKVTTLSGTAGELVELNAGRRQLFIGATLALVLLAGGLVLWRTTAGSDPEANPSAKAAGGAGSPSATVLEDAGARVKPDAAHAASDRSPDAARAALDLRSSDAARAAHQRTLRRRKRPAAKASAGARQSPDGSAARSKGSPDDPKEEPKKPYFNEL